MPTDQPTSFEEFWAKADEFIERLKSQKPVAIVVFGSSLVEEDFIPGLSDLDAYVISETPLEDVENDVKFEYFPITPNEFVNKISQGNSFALCAMNYGKTVYDPQGFVAGIYDLVDRGLSLSPTSLTLIGTGRSMGNQLSSAINLYLARPMPEQAGQLLYKNLHKIITSAGMLQLVHHSNHFVTGYTPVREALQKIGSDLVKPLEDTRHLMLDPAPQEINAEQPTLIRTADAYGAAILQVEQLYASWISKAGISVYKNTNDLITGYEQEYGQLDRVHAVRVNNVDHTHLVLGERRGNLHLFGYQTKNGKALRVVEPILPEQGKAILKRIRIIR